MLLRLARALRITAAILVALMIPATYLLMPSLGCCPAPRYKTILPAANLAHIATTWTKEVAKNRWEWTPTQQDHAFEPRLSVYAHCQFLGVREAWRRWFTEDVAGFLLRIVIFGFIELFLLRGRMLKVTAVVVPLAFVLLLGTGLAARLVENIWDGDKSYLQDYAYVPPSKWTPLESLKGDCIIAYQIRGLIGRPVVAFKSGGAGFYPEDLLAQAAEEQGFILEKPRPSE